MNNSHHAHMGSLVEKQVRNSMTSISDLARQLGVNRRTLYNWFSQKRLRPELVKNIGDCIGYDFQQTAEQFPVQSPVLPGQRYPLNNLESSKECIYKDKYLDLLERYNHFLNQAVLSSAENFNK